MPKRVRRFRFLKPLPIAAVMFALATAGWFVFGQDGLWHSWQIRKTQRAQALQIARLESKKQDLQKYLASLQSGNELALERAARNHGLVAANEVIYEIKVDSTK